MSEIITASIVIDFDAKAEDILKVEVDDRLDGLNKGKTSFAPGDEVGLLIYRTSNVTIDKIITSLGSVKAEGSGSRQLEEFITFADADEAGSNYPIKSNFSYSWIGETLGSLVLQGESSVKASSKGVAAAQIKYTTDFLQYRLINIPKSYNGLTSFPVVVFVVGRAT